MREDAPNDEQLLEALRRSETVTVEMQVEITVSVESTPPRLQIGERLPPTGSSAATVDLRGLPSPDDSREGLRATADWRDRTLAVHSWEPESDNQRDIHISRSSPRIAPPSSWRVQVEPEDGEPLDEVAVTDISADGIGLETPEDAAIRTDGRVEVQLQTDDEFRATLPGRVAFVQPTGDHTRFGVEFAPLEQTKATRFYDLLNEVEDDLVATTPSSETTPEFFRFLEHAPERATLVVEVSGTTDADDDTVIYELDEPATHAALTNRVVGIRIGPQDGNAEWMALVDHDEDDEFVIRQIGRTDSSPRTDNRQTGYRLQAPNTCSVSLQRVDDGTFLEATPVDLSRGGLGVRIPEGTSLRAGERVEVGLSIPGLISEMLPARVAFVRDDDQDGSRVGIAFEALEPAIADELQNTLSRLEDLEILKRTAKMGLAVIVFLIGLVILGTLLSSK